MAKENNGQDDLMEKVMSLAKRRGFVFPGSKIYGGLANSWDYGPLGVELKNNLRDWWWKRFVQSREDMVGIDAAILMNPKVWEASGHLQEFSDPLVECKKCHTRYRVDDLGVDFSPAKISANEAKRKGDPNQALFGAMQVIQRIDEIECPSCGKRSWSLPKQFNLMFKTAIGTTQESSSEAYLRPELAQAMFVNFKNVLDTTRKRLPFGIASVGKAFRNEITPGNFIFRTLEFDLMEFEYFIKADEWEKYFEYWLTQQQEWLKELGFDARHFRLREHDEKERAHYSKRTVDIEYETPFGWKEMFGLAYRTDFDLKKHMEKSGQNLEYTDPDTNEKFVPHVIEPTFGLTRLLLMTLLESYTEEAAPSGRVYLKLHPRLAPYRVAVFPLVKNKPELVDKAKKIYHDLQKTFVVAWDDRGNVGKRYYSQDEIGTPHCLTIDYRTLEDNTVTVRDRDSMKQIRITVDELVAYINQ